MAANLLEYGGLVQHPLDSFKINSAVTSIANLLRDDLRADPLSTEQFHAMLFKIKMILESLGSLPLSTDPSYNNFLSSIRYLRHALTHGFFMFCDKGIADKRLQHYFDSRYPIGSSEGVKMARSRLEGEWFFNYLQSGSKAEDFGEGYPIDYRLLAVKNLRNILTNVLNYLQGTIKPKCPGERIGDLLIQNNDLYTLLQGYDAFNASLSFEEIFRVVVKLDRQFNDIPLGLGNATTKEMNRLAALDYIFGVGEGLTQLDTVFNYRMTREKRLAGTLADYDHQIKLGPFKSLRNELAHFDPITLGQFTSKTLMAYREEFGLAARQQQEQKKLAEMDEIYSAAIQPTYGPEPQKLPSSQSFLPGFTTAVGAKVAGFPLAQPAGSAIPATASYSSWDPNLQRC